MRSLSCSGAVYLFNEEPVFQRSAFVSNPAIDCYHVNIPRDLMGPIRVPFGKMGPIYMLHVGMLAASNSELTLHNLNCYRAYQRGTTLLQPHHKGLRVQNIVS